MMDTSDGFLSTVHTLSVLNAVSFDISWDEKIIHPKARDFCRESGLPLSSLLFGEHGDYQLMGVLPPKNLKRAMGDLPGLKVIGNVGLRKSRSTLALKGGAKIELPLEEIQSHPRKSLSEISDSFDFVLKFLGANGLS
jgi:thiamine monophosphate kinase